MTSVSPEEADDHNGMKDTFRSRIRQENAFMLNSFDDDIVNDTAIVSDTRKYSDSNQRDDWQESRGSNSIISFSCAFEKKRFCMLEKSRVIQPPKHSCFVCRLFFEKEEWLTFPNLESIQRVSLCSWERLWHHLVFVDGKEKPKSVFGLPLDSWQDSLCQTLFTRQPFCRRDQRDKTTKHVKIRRDECLFLRKVFRHCVCRNEETGEEDQMKRNQEKRFTLQMLKQENEWITHSVYHSVCAWNCLEHYRLDDERLVWRRHDDREGNFRQLHSSDTLSSPRVTPTTNSTLCHSQANIWSPRLLPPFPVVWSSHGSLSGILLQSLSLSSLSSSLLHSV